MDISSDEVRAYRRRHDHSKHSWLDSNRSSYRFDPYSLPAGCSSLEVGTPSVNVQHALHVDDDTKFRQAGGLRNGSRRLSFSDNIHGASFDYPIRIQPLHDSRYNDH